MKTLQFSFLALPHAVFADTVCLPLLPAEATLSDLKAKEPEKIHILSAVEWIGSNTFALLRAGFILDQKQAS